MSARTDEAPAIAQWHLTHIQLVNWGTFCGYQHLELHDHDGAPARVTMVTGESGTGKSTIFDAKTAVMMRGTARFNTASNQTTGRARGARERNLYSYVMGKQDDEYDPETGEARESHLRQTSNANWSAIFLTFATADDQIFCAGRLYYVPAHSTSIPDTFYLTATRDLDPREMAHEARSKFTKTSILSVYPDAKTYETQDAFLRSLYRTLGIGRDGEGESAMKLQERIQAGTTITDVDALFKDLVIDEPSTYEMAREACTSFAEHERTWEEMDKSRQKCRDLATIRETHGEIERLEDEVALLTSLRPGEDGPLSAWLSRRGAEVYGQLGDECAGRIEGLDEDIEHLEEEVRLTTDELERLREEVAGRGGDAIDRLRAEARTEKTRIEDVREHRARLERYLKDAGRALPQDQAAFERLLEESERFLEGYQDTYHAIDERRLTLRIEEQRLSERQAELTRQLQFYRAHPSNITPRMAADRQRIASATGIPEHDLPYAAELMDIAEGQEAWRVAANVGYHGVATLMLVDRTKLDEFSVRLNEVHLNHRVSFQGVRLRTYRAPRADAGKLSSKVVFREDSPYSAWLSDWVRDTPHDYLCVESPSELGGRGNRITREGQTRQRERGAHGFARDSLIIGFSSAGRIVETERELTEVRASLTEVQRALREAREALEALQRRRDAAMQVSVTRWEALDLETHERALARLTQEIERLEADTELAQLIEQRDACARHVRELDQRLGALIQDRGKEVEQKDKAERAHEAALREVERLKALGVSVTKDQDELVRRIIDKIEEPFLASEGMALLAHRHRDGHIAKSALRSVNTRVGKDRQELDERSTALTRVFVAYRSRWIDPDDPIGTAVESYPDYLRILEELETEQLDLHIDDWLQDTLRNTGAALSPLARAYTIDRREIDRRMGPINQIMGAFKFGPDAGHLEIVVADRAPKAVRDFRGELSDWARLATKSDYEDAERLHLKLRKFMGRLEEATEKRAKGPLNTKSLVYITVVAHYPDKPEKADKAYSSLGAKSGGETQELIAFILGAALLFCLGDNGAALPTYAPIFLDEAFIKADERFTRRAIEALVGLGFQVIIAVPTSKVQAVEPVASQYVCITKDPATNHSHIFEMTGVRHDAET